MKTETATAIGLGTAVAAIVVGLIVGSSSKSSSSSSTTPPAPAATALQAGHRYRVTLTNPASNPFPTTIQVADIAQQLNGLAPGGYFSVVSIEKNTATTIVFTVDVLKPGLTYSSVSASPGQATVVDLGATPVSISAWARTTQINPGQRVRGSVSAAAFTALATALNLPMTPGGFEQLLQMPQFLAVFGNSDVTVYAPGETLPADWPVDDPNPAAEYHFDFQYTGAVTLSTLPIPALLWVPAQVPHAGLRNGP